MQKQRLEYLVKENDKARKYREIRRREDEEEDQRILEYIAKKEYENEMRLKEIERQKKEKEMETARLRALQRKSTDKKAEEDEKRARRRQHEREQADLLREQMKLDAKAAMMKEVLAEREKQIKIKREARRLEREEDRAFMRRIEAEQAAQWEKEKREKELKIQKARNHAAEVIRLNARRERKEKKLRQVQLEKDQRDAMDGDVHSHRVRTVMDRIKREHVRQGHPLPPDMVRPHESEQEKKFRKAKLYRSRPLW